MYLINCDCINSHDFSSFVNCALEVDTILLLRLIGVMDDL